MVEIYKKFRQEFRLEIVKNRIALLKENDVGGYILRQVQDSKDEALIFQDVFEAVCDELETAPLTLFNMISEALQIRGKEHQTLAEVIESI